MVDRIDYPLVYIIVLNWNGWQDTMNCIDSLEKVDYPNLETLVVDNASQNDSVERLKVAFPDLHLLESETNLGFTGGNNIGIRHALKKGADYVLLLNNDVIVDPQFLSAMVEVAQKDTGIGALNPKIYYLNHSRENTLWAAGGKTNLWLAACSNRGGDQVDIGQFDEAVEIDFGTGCCLLMSREALSKAGLLNEAYFAYFEDADWSYRLREKGLKVNYAPQARVWHAVGASSKVADTGSGTLSPFVHCMAARNHLWFIRSYTSKWQKLTAYPAYFIRRMLLSSGRFIIMRRWAKLRALWKGFWAGLKDQSLHSFDSGLAGSISNGNLSI